MKPTAALATATRTVGKLFFALTLLLVAIAVGFGGTALFVYHQFGDIHHPAAQAARGTAADRRTAARPQQNAADESAQTRRVAALSSDQSQYTYADNNGGQPSAPAKRSRPTTTVPAPLDPPTRTVDDADAAARLNDPESHYIVDARTGRVVGIDGSAGARREEEQARLESLDVPPRAVAVQTPPPEVRVASPVVEDGRPVYHGVAASTVSTAGSQYLPVRRALPVTPGATDATVRNFNAAEYMANDQDRPVLRAQAVVPPGARVVKTVRTYRLPDGSQTVVAN